MSAGTYELRQQGRHNWTPVTKQGAAGALKGYARNVPEALLALRDNPYAALTCEGGEVRWVPDAGVRS